MLLDMSYKFSTTTGQYDNQRPKLCQVI